MWRYAYQFFPVLHRYDERMHTISSHFLIKIMEGPLPSLNTKWWRDAFHFSMDMTRYDYHFFPFPYSYIGGFVCHFFWLEDAYHFPMKMNEICLPFLLLINMMDRCLPFLFISLWIWWKDAYHFSMRMMEICLPFLSSSP